VTAVPEELEGRPPAMALRLRGGGVLKIRKSDLTTRGKTERRRNEAHEKGEGMYVSQQLKRAGQFRAPALACKISTISAAAATRRKPAWRGKASKRERNVGEKKTCLALTQRSGDTGCWRLEVPGMGGALH